MFRSIQPDSVLSRDTVHVPGGYSGRRSGHIHTIFRADAGDMGNMSGTRREGATMRDRLSLLLAMGVAMLLACAGLVLAQPTNRDSEQATEGEDAVAPASSSDAGEIIPNHYIVVLDEGAAAPAAVASDLAEETGLETTHVYDDALDGFSAE